MCMCVCVCVCVCVCAHVLLLYEVLIRLVCQVVNLLVMKSVLLAIRVSVREAHF